MFGILLPPPGYNLDQLMAHGRRQSKKACGPTGTSTRTARRPRSYHFPAIGDFFFVARGRQVFMGLRPPIRSRASELVPLVSASSGQQLPGTFAVAKQSSLFEQG